MGSKRLSQAMSLMVEDPPLPTAGSHRIGIGIRTGESQKNHLNKENEVTLLRMRSRNKISM